MTEEFQRGVIPLARYQEQQLPEYQDNPLISALPPIPDLQEVVDLLQQLPGFEPQEALLDGRLRAHAIARLLHGFFQPLSHHLELESKISLMIRQGYIGRNPASGAWYAHLQNGYRRVEEEDLDAAVYQSVSSTANSLSLFGCSGCGKTRTLERILGMYPQALHHPDYDITQLVYLKIDCPIDGDLDELCLSFFNEVDKILGTHYSRSHGRKKLGMQLLALEEVQSPGYGRWTNLYRYLATECGARRGRQVRAEVIWEKILASHQRDWLAANGLLTSGEPPPWLLAMFRKHRKGFSALQHLIVWTSLRPGQHAGELISEAKTRQVDLASEWSVQLLPAEFEQKQQYRAIWLQALANHGGAKAARQDGAGACYAWLYRHDRHWLMVANQVRQRRQGNNSHIDWRARDIRLVRLLIRIGRGSEEDLGLPRRSRNWFLQQLPHRASVEHRLDQLPLCCTFLDRYAESVGEYQIRRLTAAMLKDVQTGITSRRWELEKRCGLEKSRVAPLTTAFIRLIGRWIE